MIKNINYYVSYVTKEPEYLTLGIGCCVLTRNKKIKTLEDIREVENHIQKENNFKSRITLISWKEIDND